MTDHPTGPDAERQHPARADEVEEPVQERRRRQASRHASSVNDLLARRAELRGVHAVADLLGDAVRWSA